jgi:hypothetical protein
VDFWFMLDHRAQLLQKVSHRYRASAAVAVAAYQIRGRRCLRGHENAQSAARPQRALSSLPPQIQLQMPKTQRHLVAGSGQKNSAVQFLRRYVQAAAANCHVSHPVCCVCVCVCVGYIPPRMGGRGGRIEEVNIGSIAGLNGSGVHDQSARRRKRRRRRTEWSSAGRVDDRQDELPLLVSKYLGPVTPMFFLAEV